MLFLNYQPAIIDAADMNPELSGANDWLFDLEGTNRVAPTAAPRPQGHVAPHLHDRHLLIQPPQLTLPPPILVVPPQSTTVLNLRVSVNPLGPVAFMD